MTAHRRLWGDESGFTLIEVLVTLVVITAGMFAVMGALGVGIDSGRIQRDVTTAELALRSFAEDVKGLPYMPCAEPEDYEGFTASEGIDVEVVEVRFWEWDGDPDTLGDPNEPVEFTDHDTQCVDEGPSEPAPGDQGFQQVRLSVSAEVSGVVFETLVVKREG